MNLIQLNCPGCQKSYQVSEEKLHDGFVPFQCTECGAKFGFRWPLAPGVQTVSLEKIELASGQAREFEKANRPPKVCPRCQNLSAPDSTECFKCGIIFEKFSTIKLDVPLARPPTKEITQAWEQVKNNFENLAAHENFVQVCMNFHNLQFAGVQYRLILNSNPHEEIAKKMQQRLLELATLAYAATLKSQVGQKSTHLTSAETLPRRPRLFFIGIILLLISMLLVIFFQRG